MYPGKYIFSTTKHSLKAIAQSVGAALQHVNTGDTVARVHTSVSVTFLLKRDACGKQKHNRLLPNQSCLKLPSSYFWKLLATIECQTVTSWMGPACNPPIFLLVRNLIVT